MSAPVEANDFPSRPITIVAAVAPGGSTDLTARVIADALSRQLGQQVIVENRGGAGGNIGADHVAKSDPDGYTLLIAVTGATAVNPSVYVRMPYDPATDLAAISQLNEVPQMLVINANLPPQTLEEFIEYARERPGELNFGSGGIGTLNHLASAIFTDMAGTTGRCCADVAGRNPAKSCSDSSLCQACAIRATTSCFPEEANLTPLNANWRS